MSSSETPETSGELPRRLNLLDATTIVVGCMIGSGIFLKAAAMSQLLPHPKMLLLSWLLSGLLTLCGALTLAELSARFPKTGGLYVFLKEAYGPMAGYLFAWSLLAIMQTGSLAGMASGAAKGIAQVTGWNQAQQNLCATAMIWGLTAIHCVSVRVGIGILQNLFTLAKFVAILTVIVLGLSAPSGSLHNFQGEVALPALAPFQISQWLPLISVMGLLMMKAMWAFDGWANATYIAGELKDAQRQLPRALVGGTFLVLVVYCATNVAYHYCLPPHALAASKLVPGDVVQQTAGQGAFVFVNLLIAFSVFGTLNGSIMAAPRVYFAMAADGLFFRQIAAIHPRFQTPYVALLVQAFWASCLLNLWQNFERITDNVVFIYWIFYALGAAAIFRFPTEGASYVTPLRPFTAGLFISSAIFLVGNTLYKNPGDSAQALILIVVGLVVYPLVTRKGEVKSKSAS